MPNKAIFLDRDDTLIEDPGYINHPDQVKLLDGVAEALVELKAMGYELIVVSNQSAIARGIITEKILAEIHERLRQRLAEKGACLDGIYYCPYHPDGVIPKYRKQSDLRKPNPGMLLTAAKEMDIDLSQSWMIGDSDHDIEAGLRAGCKTILINQPSHHRRLEPGAAKANYEGVNMREALNIIKKYHRSSGEMETQAVPAKREDQQAAEPETQQLAAETMQPPSYPLQMESARAEQDAAGERTERLLSNILDQLKNMQRTEMFGEFSTMRLMAGIVQVIVLFCLLIAIWFLTSPVERGNSVLIALGFAMVLQMMSLTLYVMQRRR
jgi:D-glycero-D-manno-heptose 1,7-bisphosphate phosphatase